MSGRLLFETKLYETLFETELYEGGRRGAAGYSRERWERKRREKRREKGGLHHQTRIGASRGASRVLDAPLDAPAHPVAHPVAHYALPAVRHACTSSIRLAYLLEGT